MSETIEITRHSLPIDGASNLPNGFKIAHLTDLHRSSRTSDALLKRAVELTNAEHPDVIVLTGDYVTDERADIAPCGEILAGLRARLGVYAILGNHDYGTDGAMMTRALQAANIEMLTNRNVLLEGGLRIVGLDDDRLGRPNTAQAFAEVKADETTVVLCHNPGYAEKISDRNALILAGHTHGGQIVVPFLTAWKVRKIPGKTLYAGLVRSG